MTMILIHTDLWFSWMLPIPCFRCPLVNVWNLLNATLVFLGVPNFRNKHCQILTRVLFCLLKFMIIVVWEVLLNHYSVSVQNTLVLLPNLRSDLTVYVFHSTHFCFWNKEQWTWINFLLMNINCIDNWHWQKKSIFQNLQLLLY